MRRSGVRIPLPPKPVRRGGNIRNRVHYRIHSGSVIPLPRKPSGRGDNSTSRAHYRIVSRRLWNRPSNGIENATVGDRSYNRGAVTVLFIARGFEGNAEITHERGVFALTRFLVWL